MLTYKLNNTPENKRGIQHENDQCPSDQQHADQHRKCH